MKVEDIEEVTRLRNWRRNSTVLLRQAQHGIFDVKMGTEEISLSTQVNIMPVRDFVAQELIKHIHDLEGQLRVLGVTVEETKL